MDVTQGTGPMARVKGKKSERDDVAVKVDRTLVGMARLIATQRGLSVAELLSSLLDAPIRKAYTVMLKELEKGKTEAN